MVMKIYLKNVTTQPIEKSVLVEVSERLPFFMVEPSVVQCHYSVCKTTTGYCLNIQAEAIVKLECQRCLAVWNYAYQHSYCLSEEDLVIEPGQCIDLLEIITDDLHLFLPDKQLDDCVEDEVV